MIKVEFHQDPKLENTISHFLTIPEGSMTNLVIGILLNNSFCKSLKTRVTLERFLPCVNTDMSLQIHVCFGLLMLHIVASICKA